MKKMNRQIFVDNIKPSFLFPLASASSIDYRLSTTNSNITMEHILTNKLIEAFEIYGKVEKVTIHGIQEYLFNPKQIKRRRRPYAFVTFVDESSVESVIGTNVKPTLSSFYKSAKRATVPDTWRRKPLNRLPHQKSVVHNINVIPKLLVNGSIRVDAVLQVDRSHLHRVSEYISSKNNDYDAYHSNNVSVTGIMEYTARSTLSFVFVRIMNKKEMMVKDFVDECLGKDKYIHKALNIVYAVTGAGGGGNDGWNDNKSSIPPRDGHGNRNNIIHNVLQGTEVEVCHQAWEKLIPYLSSLSSKETNNNKNKSGQNIIRIKVETFPTDSLHRIVQLLEKENEAQQTRHQGNKHCVEIAASNYTHVLSFVGVNSQRCIKNDHNDDREEDVSSSSRCYLWGITEKFNTLVGDGHHVKHDGEVSRAYYKLDEAFGRYTNDHYLKLLLFERTVLGRKKSAVALDCGAAPGGWTKYLLEGSSITSCKTVYSVDPGQLSSSVSSLPGVHHLKMKLEDAIPILISKGVCADIWVSDMCLHDMSKQIDFLLYSKSIGLLAHDALFVVTLKCTIGYSRETHDRQVEAAVKRLSSMSANVSTRHLFSNRGGERTVMGFLSN